MRQINCLNLCELIQGLYETESSFEKIIKEANTLAGFEICERLYIGSYFCGQYFLHLSKKLIESCMAVCKEKGMKVTLVIPTFTERNLEYGKRQISLFEGFFYDCIDEITVNDYGMLDYIARKYKMPINIGRLMMKDYRDPRYEAYFNQTIKPKVFTSYFSKLIKEYPIKGIEFDPTHIGINFVQKPEGLEVGLHTPYCYMTTGQICQFASTNKDIKDKFRPNSPCQGECRSNKMQYNIGDSRKWFKVGRTIYFENRNCHIEELERLRLIYFPIELEVGK